MNGFFGGVRSKVAIGAVASMLTLTALSGTLGLARAQESTPTTGGGQTPATVSVSGHGSVSLPPDTASIVLGVDVTKPTLSEAQAAAADQMTAILKALKDAGIEDKDIQTVNYSVYVQRNYDNNGTAGEITGFQVTNQVNVIVRDVDKVGDLLDAVVGAGANNIYGINFYVDDTTGPASQARKLAVQDATTKAQELADAAGMTLGRVVSISENSGSTPPPMPYAATDSLQKAGGSTPVQTGSTEVSVDVSMTFELQ
jgi:uncharacterized protein YggE